MKKALFITAACTLLLGACKNENDNEGTASGAPASLNQPAKPAAETLPPEEDPYPDMGEGTMTSPTATPLDIEQVFIYTDENGHDMQVQYSFDASGQGIARIWHPESGEILARQEGETGSKSADYTAPGGVKWSVNNQTATLMINNKVSAFRLRERH